MDYSAKDDASNTLATINVSACLREVARLANINGITGANQAAAITALTDAQIAQFVRRLLITGVVLT